MAASVLREAGYRTGLYTSPHLHSFCERIRVDGELIPEARVASLVEEIQAPVAEVNAIGKWGALTTFEIITALAFSYFRDMGVEFQVVEVGLGGRLDATNLVQPRVCVITSISYDHVGILGESLSEIAGEKAGIIKKNCTVVMAPQTDEVAGVIELVSKERGVNVVRVGHDVEWSFKGADLSGQDLTVSGRLDQYDLRTPLLGDHQLENVATTVATLEILKEQGFAIDTEAMRQGIENVSWPGRLQLLGRKPWFIVDGAHNGDSMRRLREAIIKHFPGERVVFVIGVSAGKNISDIADELAPLNPAVVITRSRHPRALQPAEVAAPFAALGMETELADDTEHAIQRARDIAGSEDIICVAGSLFIVAEALELSQKVGTA
jgi:dihydrofolate synthase/folylpolyglutamate synthase